MRFQDFKTHAPRITHSFAADKGSYGCVWKIYLEAEDPDGDMLKIASSVDQVGYGRYPTDWIYLKPQYRKAFKGYIQWNTFSSKASSLPEGTQISVKISIFDKAGNESDAIKVPFTFESGVKNQSTLSAPFNNGNIPLIGNITVDLSYFAF